MFLDLFTYLSGVLLFAFVILCLACGLFYLAEWIEENTKTTKIIFTYLIGIEIVSHVLVWIFDQMPFFYILFSIACQLVYSLMLTRFPSIELTSPILIVSAVLAIGNHFLWFYYFTSVYFPYLNVVTFFFLFVWFTPFCFFLSLSAGDNILPNYDDTRNTQAKQQNVIKTVFKYFLQQRDTLLKSSRRNSKEFD